MTSSSAAEDKNQSPLEYVVCKFVVKVVSSYSLEIIYTTVNKPIKNLDNIDTFSRLSSSCA